MLSLEESEDMVLDDEVEMYAEAFCKASMQFITVKLSPDKKSIIADEDRCSSQMLDRYTNDHYEDFLKSLPEEECCLCAVHYTLGTQPHVIFVTWCPEGCELRDALLLNVTKYQFSKLVHPNHNVKASELSDLDEEEIKEQLETGRPATAIGAIFDAPAFNY